jgi:hypothetical protein
LTTVRELLLQLGEDDAAIRDRAAARLLTVSPEVLERILRQPAAQSDWRIRANAAALLGRVSDSRFVSTLLLALTDEKADAVKPAIVAALAQSWLTLGDPFDAALDCAVGALDQAQREILRRNVQSVNLTMYPDEFREAIRSFVYLLRPSLDPGPRPLKGFREESGPTRSSVTVPNAFAFDGIAWVVDIHGVVQFLSRG